MCTTETNFCRAKVRFTVTECGLLSSFALFRHIRYGRYCYKQATYVKLQVFYHVLSYNSAAGSGFLEV